MSNRFEKLRQTLRTQIAEREQKLDTVAEEAARCLLANNAGGYEAAQRIGMKHGAAVDWLDTVLTAVDRVEAEQRESEEREASRRSMLLRSLRTDSVEASSLRDMAERVIRNLSWKHPHNGVQLFGAALGRELVRRGIEIEPMDLEILTAATKTKHNIGTTSYECRELLGGYGEKQ